MAGQITVSTIRDDTGVLATQNGMTGIAKAWVNFDGTGTPSIRGSFNVSSITDNGTGYYTVNFTTVMPNANYSMVGCVRRSSTDNAAISGINIRSGVAPTTSAVAVMVSDALGSTAGALDVDYVCVSIFSS
jgi:hypothetical protein